MVCTSTHITCFLSTLWSAPNPAAPRPAAFVRSGVDKEEVMRVTVMRVYTLKMFSLLNIFYNNYMSYKCAIMTMSLSLFCRTQPWHRHGTQQSLRRRAAMLIVLL